MPQKNYHARSSLQQSRRHHESLQKKAYGGFNAVTEAVYETVIGDLRPPGLGTTPLKMAHFDNVHRWSIVSIFAFLYRLGQNQPAVQIFDTHKKARIKWASSDFIIMFWCGRLPYNEGRLIACNYYCCFTLRPLASLCFERFRFYRSLSPLAKVREFYWIKTYLSRKSATICRI